MIHEVTKFIAHHNTKLSLGENYQTLQSGFIHLTFLKDKNFMDISSNNIFAVEFTIRGKSKSGMSWIVRIIYVQKFLRQEESLIFPDSANLSKNSGF